MRRLDADDGTEAQCARLRTADETFGQRLRRERECRHITIESIAEKTKISASLFEALERDNVSRWPAGVFRRAFIRSYAQAIGLDPDAIMREFLDRFPDPAIVAAHPADAPTRGGAPASTNTALRLTMEDTHTWFTGGRFLTSGGRRWAAVGSDMAIVGAIAALMFLVLGMFWMPLALSALSYYAVSIIVLGNTPGVCLFAPAAGRPPSNDTPVVRQHEVARREHDILRSLIAARQVAASNKGS